MTLQERALPDLPALVEYMLSRAPADLLWFRGQGCDQRSLRTSLQRRLTTKTVANLLQVERRLITRFRQRSLALWPEGYPQTDWEHLFAMQHFGVPTRLLDWTESLLVGAYFAGDHNVATCGCGSGACQPTVWILNPVRLNQENKRLDGLPVHVLTTVDDELASWKPGVLESQFASSPVAMYGTHNSPRIVAQQGTFTVWGREYNPLEECAAVETQDDVLEKITLGVDHATLLSQLRILGIRRGTVYPDLPGLSHDITSEEVF